MSQPDVAELIAAARKAATGAYAPYSNARFGCAVLFEGDATIYTGANVENAAYGSTICAERVAICAAVARRRVDNQCLKITHVVVSRVDEHGDPRTGSVPCGACLQVVAEFGSLTTAVLLDGFYRLGETAQFTMTDLLPEQFWFPAD